MGILPNCRRNPMTYLIGLQCLSTSPYHYNTTQHLLEAKRNKEEIRKIANHLTYGLWPFLKIFNLGHINLCQWFGNSFKLKRIPFASKKPKSNQRKIKNLVTCDNGHM
jgi:hypothetical protein